MITNMSKITFVGVEADKKVFLRRLQEVGAVHLLLPQEPLEPGDLVRELARVRETRKFLVPKAGPGAVATSLDAREVCDRREALGLREAGLQSRMATLKKELAALEAWGDFDISELQRMQNRGLHTQFFRAPLKLFAQLPLEGVFHQEIRSRGNEVLFVTVSTQPLRLEAGEEKLPGRSLSQTRDELAAVEAELRQVEAEYRVLAKRLDVLESDDLRLRDLFEYRRALMNLPSALDARLFILRCWSPLPEAELLAKLRPDFAVCHYSEPAGEEERVPVLLRNRAGLQPRRGSGGGLLFPELPRFRSERICSLFFRGFFRHDHRGCGLRPRPARDLRVAVPETQGLFRSGGSPAAADAAVQRFGHPLRGPHRRLFRVEPFDGQCVVAVQCARHEQ